MHFISTRIITDDVDRLVRFYEQVTGTAMRRSTADFAELITPSATLAIGSTRTLTFFGGEIARPAQNHSALLEFLVPDVDAEHARLAELIADALVQNPTTMPWGNRSLLFRDPDGNLVNLFTPVSAEARQRFSRFA